MTDTEKALRQLLVFAEIVVEQMDIDPAKTMIEVNVVKDGHVIRQVEKLALSEVLEKSKAALRAAERGR